MKQKRLGTVLATMLLALAPAVLLGDETTKASAADDDATASAASAAPVAIVTGDDGEDVYVVQDTVFVEESLPEIPGSSTIAAKLPLPLAETPLAVAEVGAALLERRDAQVLGDALESVAGVHVQSGNGLFDAFTLRGLDTIANGRILIDGAPEPQSAFYQLYNVERVEVLKGPSSFLYGAFAMGGAINLVRKQPRPGDFVSLGFSGGSYATWQGTLDANHFADSERWGVRLNAQWWQSDLHRDDKRAEVFAVNPAFTFRASDRTSVHFNLEYADTDAVPDSGLPLVFTRSSPGGDRGGETQGFTVPDVPRERTYDAAFNVSEQQVYRLQVDVETRFSDNFLLRNKTYYRRFDWLSDTTSLDGVFASPFDPTGTPRFVARTQLVLDDRQSFTGNQLEALWRVETGGVRHNLLFGFEVARLADEFTFNVASLPFIDLFTLAATVQGPIPLFAFGADATSTVMAPYVVDQIHFSEKFQLLLGLRYDDIDFEDDAVGLQRDDSKASPMIGAVFSPRETFSVYVNAGQAFSPQSTFVVGESRDPEESDQVELGLRAGSADGKLRASLALYRIDRDHVAIPDQTGVTQQTGSQRTEGVELELDAELRPGLTATVAYARTDAELTEFTAQSFFVDPATGQVTPFTVDLSGNAAAWVPENVASLWLSQRFDNGWGVAAGGRWVDEQFTSEDNAFAIDDFFRVDAVVWYGQSPWRLQVNLDNLTDEETFTRVFAGSSVIPAPGFTARAGIRYGF